MLTQLREKVCDQLLLGMIVAMWLCQSPNGIGFKPFWCKKPTVPTKKSKNRALKTKDLRAALYKPTCTCSSRRVLLNSHPLSFHIHVV